MGRFAVAIVFLGGAVAVGQPPQNLYPQPRIQSVVPAGAKAGSRVEVAILGTDLDDATRLVFGHPGLTAELPPVPPPAPADPKKKDPPAAGKRKATPPTEAKFIVSAAADVPPGVYDVRLVNRYGISNPRCFVVGDRPETLEREPNNDVPEANKIALNSVVNGVISSSIDVDYSTFPGKAGQRVLVHCAAASIDSRLKPQLEIFGPTGRRLTSNRNYADTDALADLTLPTDGDYLIRLTEFAHQSGGPDHFYRLSVGTGPWIDAIHPPVVEAGKPARVTLFGRNLPGGKVVPGQTVDGRPVEALEQTITPPAATNDLTFRRRVDPVAGLLDGFEFRLPGSNPVGLTVVPGPVTIAKDAANDTPETAELVTPPCDVAGRFEVRNDRDWYTFTAKKGDSYRIDLLADRLGSTIDAVLTVRNATTKQDLANEGTLDDNNDSLHPTSYFNRTVDPPTYVFKAPADGQYQVLVQGRDSNVAFGPRAFYCLSIQKLKPDFRLVVMARSRELPGVPVIRPKGETAVDVFVYRFGGFSGNVTVNVTEFMTGLMTKNAQNQPCVIGGFNRWGTLILSGAPGLSDADVPIRITGTATIGGQAVTRSARAATITWGLPGQQNVPLVVRLTEQFYVSTRGESQSFRLSLDSAKASVKKNDKETPAKAPFLLLPGEKLTLPVKVEWHEKEARANPVNVVMEATVPNPQQADVSMNNGQPVTIPKDKTELPMVIDVKPNARPGLYTVSLRGETVVKFAKDPADKEKRDITVAGYAPTIELSVLPKELVKPTVAPPGPGKIGSTLEIPVKMDRQHDFDGELKLTVQLPKDVVGIQFEALTLAAGATEGKLKATIAKDAKPGAVNNLVLTVIGMWEGRHEVKDEAKFNLTVQK